MDEILQSHYETDLKTILTTWGFPQSIILKYNKTLGVNKIFEWQAECLFRESSILCDYGNLVYSAPTSAGKTLVAELLMLKNVLETKRKALMILPFVALAKEKLRHLQKLLSDVSIRVEGFIGNNTPSFSTLDIGICTIEKANGLINRLIEEEHIDNLSTIVVDELHMVGDSSRGYLLEMILTKLKYLLMKNQNKNNVQIIGMSATLPNLDVLATWLNAVLYQTNYRPVPLSECYKFGNDIFDKDKQLIRTLAKDVRIKDDDELLIQLVLEVIMQKLGVLVFCPSKQRCEILAGQISSAIHNLAKLHAVDATSFLSKENILKMIAELKMTPAGLDEQLNKCIRYGIAFHHAGLTTEEREVIETAFRKGSILCIVATSTLSSGVNLPARRVIIRTPIFNGHRLDIMTYKQMAGRAGRKGIDIYGESILMCANASEKRSGEALLSAEMNHVKSSITASINNKELWTPLKRALLEAIVSGIATTKREIISYTACFLVTSPSTLDCEGYFEWLRKHEFITKVNKNAEEDCYKPTQLGYAVVASSMSPDDGLVILGELQKAMKCMSLENDLHLIYEVTPLNVCDYWTNSTCQLDWTDFHNKWEKFSPDVSRVAALVGVRGSFIERMMHNNPKKNQEEQRLFLRIHQRFYTALILNDLVNEVSFSDIMKKYSNCHKGFLQMLQQHSSTYAAMVTIFCNKLGWHNLEMLFQQFQARLLFGVQQQLIDLVRISLLNATRARLFYNAGCTNVAAVAACDIKKTEKILRSGISFVSNQQNDEQNKATGVILIEGGETLTYWEASEQIHAEANAILRRDLDSMGVVYASSDMRPNTSQLNHTFNKTTRLNDSSFNTSQSIINTTREDIQKQPNDDNSFKRPLSVAEPNISLKENKSIDETTSSALSLLASSFETSSVTDQALLKASDRFEQMRLSIHITPHLPKDTKEQNFSTPQLVKTNENAQPVTPLRAEKQGCCTPAKHEFVTPNFLKHTKPVTPVSVNALNSTFLSDDEFKFCIDVEKKALAGKENKTPADLKTKTSPLPKSLVAQTLLKQAKKQETPKRSPLLNKQTTSFPPIDVAMALEKLATLLKITSLNILANGDELEIFSKSIPSKSKISLSLACEREANNTTKDDLFHFEYRERGMNVVVYGMFVCLEKQLHFLVFRQDTLFVKYMKEILEREDVVKVLFFAKEQIKFFCKMGIFIKKPCYDLILANYLLDLKVSTIAEIQNKFGSEPVDNRVLDRSLQSVIGSYGCNLNTTNNNSRMQLLNSNIILRHALIECFIAFNCFEKLKLQLQYERLWSNFSDVEMRIVLISAGMELVGLGLSRDELEIQKAKLKTKKQELENKIFSMTTNKKLNLNSPKDISHLIYVELNLQPDATTISKSTAIKHHKTSKEALQLLAKQHPIPKLIIEWRKVDYTLNHSIYPLERALVFNKLTNMFRVHSTIDLYIPTGRMSFNDPNLQSIPRDFDVDQSVFDAADTEDARYDFETSMFVSKLEEVDDEDIMSNTSNISVRNIFVASTDRVLLSVDYSQLELRIIANLCKDEALISIFNDNKSDVFVSLASKWLGLPENQISDEHRQNVKKIVYGIMYGISAKTLGLFLNCSEDDASKFIESFKVKFTGLRTYIAEQIEICKEKGYVETISKRKRHLPDIKSADSRKRAQAERQAINTVIQGSAADLVKSAMVKIEKNLQRKYKNLYGVLLNDTKASGAFLVLNMHDELIFEVCEAHLKDVKRIVRDGMENCMEFCVRMKVKMKVGKSWGSLITCTD